MVQRHGDDGFTFIGVYIQEAHAIDEWPISEAPREFRQHQSLDERIDACNQFQQDFQPWLEGIEFYVDTITNDFQSAYASWPFRFWVITQSEVIFKPMPKNASYDLSELEDCLIKLSKDR